MKFRDNKTARSTVFSSPGPVLMAILLMVLSTGCDSYVNDADPPINSIDDFQLNSESQVDFVIKGVEARFATTYGRITVFSRGLSDEFIFDDRVLGATYPEYRAMDRGEISLSDGENTPLYEDLGELRFFADNLLERISEIAFEDVELEQRAKFTGSFYGGMARYFLATYYGLSQEEGGGVISTDPSNPGPFVPSEQMYDLAVVKLTAALEFADDYESRVIGTLLARIALFEGDYALASTRATSGMVEGDLPFSSLHASTLEVLDAVNAWFFNGGPGRTQWVTDFRFNAYVNFDPAEAARIPLIPLEGSDGATFYMQAKYLTPDSPMPFATWQENQLILAEAAIRGAGSGLAHINAVRTSHGLDPLLAADLDTIIEERDKELFTMGMRLVDQRRLGLWHLPAGTWQYLPITQNERNQNPNF